MTPNHSADFFESLRPRLFGIAYRMLGVVADAEEVVQDAFLRSHRSAEAPRSDEAWLVSVTTRLAIDRLRRAATERTACEGQWLPEPVPLAPPDRAADLAEDRDALLALLTDDAVLVADGGGRMPAIGDVQQGAARIAQLLAGCERMGRVQLERRGAPALAYELAWLNGEPAVLTLVADRLLFATVLHLDGERVAGLYRVMNPAKLAAIGRPTVLGPDQTLRDLL